MRSLISVECAKTINSDVVKRTSKSEMKSRLKSLIFRRKDLCEAKPGYCVGNFDHNIMLCFGGGVKHSVVRAKRTVLYCHYAMLLGGAGDKA